MKISNAAGTVKLIEQAERLAKAPVDEVVMGSFTLRPRIGNSGSVFAQGETYSLNAIGLANPGIGYIELSKAQLMRLEKPLVISIAGDDPTEYREMARICRFAYAVELNFGCPNLWSAAGWQKRIGTFDPLYVHEVIEQVRSALVDPEYMPQVRVKLSPISDPLLLSEVAGACEKAEVIVACNTFPNGWAPGALSTPYGGVSGPAMKPIVLGQVRQYVAHGFNNVIGVGGVQTAQDVKDYEAAGAIGVQVGTRYLAAGEDPDIFTNLALDLHG